MSRLHKPIWAGMCVVAGILFTFASAFGQRPANPPGPEPRNRLREEALKDEPPVPKIKIEPPVPLTSDLDPNFRPIDLNTALRLAGVQNPQILLARQRVVESLAERQLAAARLLPSLNIGTNYTTHTGVLQQSSGNILGVNRSSIFVGAGANAVAAGTVTIPGIGLSGNVAELVFNALIARQFVEVKSFANIAERNQALLAVTRAYCELLRAEGRRAVALQVRGEADEVYRLVAAYAKVGQNREADARRAGTELAARQAETQRADGEIQVASAKLCAVLHLDPSVRLHPTDAWVVPISLVPPPMPLSELVAVAMLRRPELLERRAAIQQALLALEGNRVLPFSPTMLVGFSAGGFGGGSNLVRPVFGRFNGRTDFDVYAYWTIQNLGIGNVALINQAKAKLGAARYQELATLDRVREDVATAYARAHARFGQIATGEQAVRSGATGFREDLTRARGAVGLPIEVLDSLRLLEKARVLYLDAIVDYNRAQFELYVALGQPPADALARPVPTDGVNPTPAAATERARPPAIPPPPPAGAAPFAAPARRPIGP